MVSGEIQIHSMFTTVLPIVALAVVVAYRILVRVGWLSRNASRLPPGPPPLPLLGNVLELPSEYQERKLQEWGKRYGKHLFQLTLRLKRVEYVGFRWDRLR